MKDCLFLHASAVGAQGEFQLVKKCDWKLEQSVTSATFVFKSEAWRGGTPVIAVSSASPQ